MSSHIVATTVAAIIIAYAMPNCYAYAQTKQPLPAQDSIPSRDTIRIKTLQDVIIRAGKYSSTFTSPTPVQVLSGESLRKMNTLSVADAIRYFAGVQLKDYGGIGGLKTVNIRSMGTNHTAVFFDGIQVSNAQNGQIDLGKFSLDNIEEIALYNGQKNVLLQPAKGFSAGGSIYLRTRRPVFTGTERTHATITLKTGSFGLFNPSVLWQQKLSKQVAASLNAEWLQSLGNYKFQSTNGVYDTTTKRHNADIQAWRMEGGLHGFMADSSEWNVKLYAYVSDRGLPGAVVANKFWRGQRQWDRNLFAQASWNKSIGNHYTFLLNAKYAHDYQRYVDPEFTNIQGYLENRYYQQDVYLSAANQYSITSWWDVSLSGDLQWNQLRANLERFAYPTRTTALGALATRAYNKRMEAQASLLGTFVHETVKAGATASDKQEYTPTIMASWQPFAAWPLRIRAFYKNIFRMPTFNDLYYTQIGNTLLKPEYTRQYNAGLTFTTQGNGLLKFLSAQADAYYTDVTDKIVAIPTRNLYRWAMVNLGKVSIHGIDATVQSAWAVSHSVGLTARLSYTYQEAEDRTPNGDNYGHQIVYTPWHSGAFTAGATYTAWQLNYSFIYTGERYNQITNIPVNYTEPWYTHDLALNYQFTPRRIKAVSLTASVNNLFNQQFDVVINFPMPGRHYRFTCQIQLQ